MKALLVFPTPKREEVYFNTLPPLGMLTIASYLESKSIPTDVVDCHVTRKMKNFADYDVICFSVNVANVENTVEYIKEIRALGGNRKIIIGGPQDAHRAEFWVREHGVNAVVIGEGEIIIHNYLTAADPLTVKGLVVKDPHGKIVFTGPAPLVMKLDTLPFAALDKVPIHKYNSPFKQAFPISSIITSRGCPSQCTFCFHNPVWRQRSAKNVVDEMEWQHKKLGVNEFWVADDNFTLNRQRAWDICEDIIKRGLNIKLQCKNGIRVDKVDYELLKKMKEAGVWLVSVAPESGNPETLIRVKKDFTLERVDQVVKWCKELDIKTVALFIIGLPWETPKDIYDTLEFARKLNADFVQFARYTPIEGTPLYEEVKDRLVGEFNDVAIHAGTLNYNAPHISAEEMGAFYKTAYRSYYLRLSKIFNILRMLSLRDIFYSLKYTLASGNM
ncbi:radical SAM protein [Candidatus Woesearchaeota archaeon]|nr:radical SAM protein [Candidatus Woesearchaeota archaeon]